MGRAKFSTTLRITPDARELIRELSYKLGVDKSAVLELAIRHLAKAEDVTVHTAPAPRADSE